MERSPRTRTALLSLGLPVLLLAVPMGLTWRQIRQAWLNRTLRDAVMRDDAQTVIARLQQGADANARFEFPDAFSVWYWLRQSLRGRHYQPYTNPALQVAIEQLEFRHPPFSFGSNATRSRDRSTIVKALLDNGAHVNAADPFGNTALLFAAACGDTDTATLLLQHGADVDAADHYGQFPLLGAIQTGQVGMVRLLLAYHADVTRKGWRGYTPLALAQQWPKRFPNRKYVTMPQIIRLLKEAGAKP